MEKIIFYACEEDVELIRAEQVRLGATGLQITTSEAIRSLILKSAIKEEAEATPVAAPEGVKFVVLPAEKVQQNGRAEKVFID
jgi:hypothetical protein